MSSVFFRVVADCAGVKWSRASSPLESFADANRMAKEAAAKGRNARVYVFAKNDKQGLGTIVAEYHHVDGTVVTVEQ